MKQPSNAPGRVRRDLWLVVLLAVLSVLAVTHLSLHVSATAGPDVSAWTRIGQTGNVDATALVLGGSGHIYVGTYHKGLFVTTDGGAHWANLLLAAVAALAGPPGSPATVYAGTWSGGAHKSTDSGATWIAANTGLGADNVYELAVDPAATSTVYAGTEMGIWRSTDGGAHWQDANTGFSGRVVYTLAFGEGKLYAGTDQGAFASTDGGAHWAAANEGLAAGEVFALAASSDVIYAGTDRGGVVRAGPAGVWSAASIGLPADMVSALAVHPTQAGMVFAGTGQGVYASTNRGMTWQAMNDGLSGYGLEIAALALDVSASPAMLYAGTGTGVWRRAVDAPVPSGLTYLPLVLRW